MKTLVTTLILTSLIYTANGQNKWILTSHRIDTFFTSKIKNDTLIIDDVTNIKFISIMGRVYRITAPTLEEVKPEPVFNFPPWERRQYFPSQGIDTIRSGGIMLYNWPNKFYQL